MPYNLFFLIIIISQTNNRLLSLNISCSYLNDKNNFIFSKQINEKVLTIRDIDDFKNLYFVCPINFTNRGLNLITKNQIVFDSDLKITIPNKDDIAVTQFLSINFYNLKGMDLDTYVTFRFLVQTN